MIPANANTLIRTRRTRTLALVVGLALGGQALAQPHGRGAHGGFRAEQREDTAVVVRVDRYVDPYHNYYREQCWNERTRSYDDDYYRDERGRLYREEGRNNATGTVVGVIVGGAIGNQVGKGDGRKAATIAGAAIGGSIGYQVDRANGDREYRGGDGVVRRCRTIEGRGGRHRNEGFDVTYRYGGQIYSTYMRRHPGRSLRIQVEVTPLER